MIGNIFLGPYATVARWTATAVAIAVFGTFCYAKGYNRMNLNHKLFVAQIEVVSEQAKARNAVTNAKNKADKEKADEKVKRDTAALASTIAGLRARPGSGRVPAAPPDSRRPDLACFDRPEYQRAYGELLQEIRGLSDEGSKSTIGLDAAKEWAK